MKYRDISQSQINQQLSETFCSIFLQKKLHYQCKWIYQIQLNICQIGTKKRINSYIIHKMSNTSVNVIYFLYPLLEINKLEFNLTQNKQRIEEICQVIKLQSAIFPLSQHVLRFHELPVDIMQRFLQ